MKGILYGGRLSKENLERCRGGWCSGESRDNFGIGLWKEIRKD